MKSLELKNNLKILLFIFIYIVFSCVSIYLEYHLLPVAMAFVLLVIFVSLYRIDWIYDLIIFTTPFSIALRFIFEDKELPVDLFVPSEALILITYGIVIFKIIDGQIPGKKFLRHPITIAIGINLLWIFITSLTSTMPLVSLKFFLSRSWFLVVYFLLTLEFVDNHRKIYKYFYLYILGLIPVVIYSIIRLAKVDIFNKNVAHWVMNPFYSDHTSYGAIIAMLLPPVIGMFIVKKNNISERAFLFVIFLILTIGLIFSYTRAAWLSIIFAMAVMFIVLLKIRFSILLIIIAVISFFVYSQWTEIEWLLEKNRKTSSVELVEHVQSITNITTDMSNLERLNRWSCAVRMFKEKPLFGWGPGTYMFQYAPFQLTSEKTLISTNMSDLGNAHSEYLGPLSESGILGLLSFLAIIIVTLLTGLNAYKYSKNNNTRVIILSLILGLCTYYFHGLLNNFLDTDKASALFWGFTAILMILQQESINKTNIKN